MQMATSDDDDVYFDDCLALLTGDATATAQDATLPKKRQRGLSLRKEIERLRAKRDDLEAQLQALQSQRALTPTASAWAARAQRQAVAAQHAMHEHARLQELLREQLRLVATLERAFARKPKACNFPCVASWKMAKLGPNGRREDMLRLTQLQYDKLETEWIRHGLHDFETSNSPVRKRYVQPVDGSLGAHLVECSSWDVDMATLADVVWSMFTHELPPSPLELEIDGDISYLRYTATMQASALPPEDGRLLSRRFLEPARAVFVCRSIHEDALYPPRPAPFVGNQCSWLVLLKTGPEKTRLLSYARLTPPVVTTDTDEFLTPSKYTECMLQLLDQCGTVLQDSIQHALTQHASRVRCSVIT